MATKSIEFKNSAPRAISLVAVLVCLIGVYFVAKWSFGNTVALQSQRQIEYADPIAIGEFAVGLAPSDPQTHYALAALYDKSFLPENQSKSLAAYEQATALAPNDFRLWLSLGRARERNGDAAGAENAVRRAASLAPNYSLVQWTLGNVLLRQNKTAEAFAEIGKAVRNDSNYANPAIAAAWQKFDGDLTQIRQILGDSTQVKTALASFLLKQKKYRGAMQIFSELNGAENFAVGKISNAGFESNEKREDTKDFEWQIADGAQPQIGVDTGQKHNGINSLGFVFNSADGKDFRNVSQLVAIESGKKYVFETFYKADLKTTATLRWEIVNEADGKVLVATDAVSTNADWTSLKTEFTAPELSEAVIIRLVRDQCKTSACSISGRIWFDDFNLTSN